MRFERLSEQNVEKYVEYLMEAFTLEPDRMIADSLDAEGIRERVRDPFYLNTTSILAVVDDKVVGRIEYHFYGCMQDGYRMAYIDWIYVLPGYRHRGIAQSLFIEM